ncbi:HAD family hydrolase [Aliikangiella coralliicola]|uniref:HAD-IA family hydrolase n=1 Tax=Aliikangiella coralliicola TaxID=2592383 RepID=A0A545UD40_9GAMM|nr:HAD-IA family hydrolase [Aliikangiella coralliicola]TQV87380.1 HAD-IA family hydrolase [Aliikangiella coralliicola]
MSVLRNRYSFIIFDWDGTLMDSTGRIVSSMQSTAKIADLPIPSEESVKSIIGLSMDAVMDTMFPSANGSLREKLFEIYRHQYVEGDDTPSPLFQGSLPLLNWLKQINIPIAVATGKARHGLTRVLNEVNLIDFFDHTICADEAESKPHPEMVERLVVDANKSKQETLVIGDSIHDMKMANNAGVDAVAVTSGANQSEQLSEHNPVSILPRVCDLRQWLEQ